MKTEEGTYVLCIFTGKVCYTEREAGGLINDCKRHVYLGNSHYGKKMHSKVIPRRKYLCRDCGYYHVTHQALFSRDDHNAAWENGFYKDYERNKKRVRA